MVTTLSLLIVSAPDLIHLQPADVPLRVWPAVLYCGVLSSGMGYLIESYAFRTLGPVRTSSYSNFTPIVAAAAAFIVLGEALKPGVLIGVALTVIGVLLVRQNTYLRRPAAPQRTTQEMASVTPAPEPASAAGR
jgi:drug/metabolite transporter (DMT)-like permease